MVLTESKGRVLANLVYSSGATQMYICVVPETMLYDGDVRLSGELSQYQFNGHLKYWESKENDGTLFVWKSNNVVCSAVSNVSVDEFAALINLQEL